jgi:hypothetical protein
MIERDDLELELPAAVTEEDFELVEEEESRYWAAEKEESEFASHIQEKVRKYWEHLQRTQLYARIRRSWKYYHNLFYDQDGGEREIKCLGEDGLAGLSVNHLRNLLQHLLTLATQNPPNYDVLASNTDTVSLKQSRLGNQLLDHYTYAEHVGEVYKRAVENALVMSVGYVKTVWDPRKDGPAQPGPMGMEPAQGDLSWSAPGFFDVTYDYQQTDWDKQRWVIVRTLKNRWELAAQYPEKMEEIENWQPNADEYHEFIALDPEDGSWSGDVVPVYEFYHISTDALPGGRYAEILGDNVLNEGPIPYDDLPVDRVVSGEFLGTSHGYTTSFDLQGLQEAINGEVSTILSNHKSFGTQILWTPTASNVTYEEYKEKNLLVISSDEEPKAINLTSTPAEIFQFIAVIMQHMEYVSGVNSVLRGQPEANLKSGRALALIAAQAVQFASPLINSYNALLERNGTKVIRILRTFIDEPRLMALVGKHKKSYIGAFTGDDLVHVDRVRVVAGNAMTATLAGRVEIADKMLAAGFLRNREEYVTVMTTGQLDALLEGEESQLNIIREEGERLMEGGPHRASVMDYHVLHMREHHAVLNSTAAREDPMLSQASLAALMEHMQMLMDPMIQAFQTVLGYPTVLPPLPGLSPTGFAMQGSEPGEPGAPAGPTNPMDRPPAEGPAAQAAAEPFTSSGAIGG